VPKNGSHGGWRSVLRMKVQIENLTVPKSAKEWFSWRMEVHTFWNDFSLVRSDRGTFSKASATYRVLFHRLSLK